MNKKYSVDDIIVPDLTGWNHYIIMCSKSNTTHVVVNGKKQSGEISNAGTLGTSGGVSLGMRSTSYPNAFLADELKIWYSALDIQ